MDKQEIRLQVLKTVIPHATRVGITEPATLIEKCSLFENYVVGSESKGAEKPVAPVKKKKVQPRKG